MSGWNPKTKLSTFLTDQLKKLRDAAPTERAKAP
jgi:hypothetical protein